MDRAWAKADGNREIGHRASQICHLLRVRRKTLKRPSWLQGSSLGNGDARRAEALLGGVLAQGLGPETVAVRIVGVASEADIASAGDELFDAA